VHTQHVMSITVQPFFCVMINRITNTHINSLSDLDSSYVDVNKQMTTNFDRRISVDRCSSTCSSSYNDYQ